MATRAPKLVWAARHGDASSRAAVASAHSTRAGAVTSRAARLGTGNRQTCGDASDDNALSPLQEDIESNEFARAFCEFWGRILSDAPSHSSPREIIDPYPDVGVDVTEKDLESDEALWALYEHWCKVFNKKRDHAEMVRRFPVFKMTATVVNSWSTYVPEDPRKAAAFLKGKKKAERRLAKGLDVPSCYEQKELGPFADGVDPLHSEHSSYLNEDQEMDQSPVSAA